MTTKRWVLYGAIVVALALLAVFLWGVNRPDANAATLSEPPDGTSFTVQLTPTNDGVTLSPDGKATRHCWYWKYGPSESRDGVGALRFGWGREDVACTNVADTRWVALPQFDPFHYLGYWEYDRDGSGKNKSALGYSFLQLNSTDRFTFKPVGVPLLSRERTLRCKLVASNHTAYCTIYY